MDGNRPEGDAAYKALSPKRISYKVIGAVLGLALGLASQIILARTMGPERFGDYTFVTSISQGVAICLDLGVTSYLFTVISKGNDVEQKIKFLTGHLLFVIFVSVTVGLALGAAAVIVTHQAAFDIGYLALCWLFGTSWYVYYVTDKLLDSTRHVGLNEAGKLFQKLIFLLLLVAVSAIGNIDLYSAILIYSTSIILYGAVANIRAGLYRTIIRDAQEYSLRGLVAIWPFCQPIALVTALGSAGLIIDRWLIHSRFGGDALAALGLGALLSSYLLITCSPILSLFWQDLARAHDADDAGKKAADVFKSTCTMVFYVSCVVAVFQIFFAEDIVSLLFGKEFLYASQTVVLFALYTLFGALGQVSATTYVAIGANNLYLKIAALSIVTNIIVTLILIEANLINFYEPYLMIALKMTVVQVVFVSYQILQNAKSLSVDRVALVRQLFKVGFVCAAAGFVSKIIMSDWLSLESSVVTVCSAGIIYIVLVNLLSSHTRSLTVSLFEPVFNKR